MGLVATADLHIVAFATAHWAVAGQNPTHLGHPSASRFRFARPFLTMTIHEPRRRLDRSWLFGRLGKDIWVFGWLPMGSMICAQTEKDLDRGSEALYSARLR